MDDIELDIIELASIIGHQSGELDALDGNAYGTRIPKVREDLRKMLQGLDPIRLSNFWTVFEQAYDEAWDRRQTEH